MCRIGRKGEGTSGCGEYGEKVLGGGISECGE